MKKTDSLKKILCSAGLGITMLGVACGGGAKPPAPPAPTQPAAPTNTAPAKPTTGAGSTKTADSSPKPDAPKKTLPGDKKVAVPADWVTMYDEVKGYEFEVPAGSQAEQKNVNGVDVFIASTPDPGSVDVMVFAYKDKTLTRENLLEDAEGVLTGLGAKDIKIDNLKDISDDYGLADAAFTLDGKPHKVRILVATDVTDNYIMIVGTDEPNFKSKEQIIDGIWGSFSMYSGGASGDS